MIWGGIFTWVKSQLIVLEGNMTAIRYRDEIFCPVAVTLMQQCQLLQQDNARPHVARICQDFQWNSNIVPQNWQPYSQNLSSIEHLWDDLDRMIRRHQNPQLPSNN